MQVKFDEVIEKKFEPISITFKIESIEDARALYAICNFSTTADLLGTSAARIKSVLHNKYDNDAVYARDGEEIANGIMYEDLYK